MLYVFSVSLLGMLIGNELCIALFVHPALYKLPEDCHLRAVQPLARTLGRAMPFWYIGVFALAFAECIFCRGACPYTYAGTALIAVSIVLTLVGLVPINRRMARLDPAHPPENWLVLRRRWDLLHKIRIGILIVALILMANG
jgi:hypothetical protein